MADPVKPADYRSLGCDECACGQALGFDFSMAFQPIVDLQLREVVGYEALCRGVNGESAASVIARVDQSNLYRFDQTCRVKAIELAAKLNLKGYLSINFLPNAVYRPELCIRTTLAAARRHGFPVERIMFEITEVEQVGDSAHLRTIVDYYQRTGFITALDDFGAGYAGLNLLSSFHPDVVKLDRELISNIDQSEVKQIILRHLLAMCDELDILILAEGVEKREELEILLSMGVKRFQGYLFAKPGFECLPEVSWP
ncbi:EAL domain-containing protein [Gilvimarinus sp. DA14]|uniref:EAL domain-containing protein n=1 Tax=Gilvimarinus sp. DA14 TaxID=2956798 RepID=UPI0020B6FA78|nr:EAL domain-containing protein [Gilvimarinus sp. DA14]UTF61705.1 EAL domain-containing protein [Gilvimarinus sp. DA14]